MFLESQNQFRRLLEQEPTGTKSGEALNQKPSDEERAGETKLNLEPGYAELYSVWAEENKEILYKLSSEEKTQRFAEYIRGHVQDHLLRLVDEQVSDAEENKHLKERARRGQLLLVSTDGGKHFDRFLTAEKAATVKATDYLLLSPTFRTASTDFKEVFEEQTLLHVVAQFSNQTIWGSTWLVNQAWLENGVVHVEVIHYKYGSYDVNVEVDQDTMAPLNYEFISSEGRVTVPETQLPEKYGEIRPDSSLHIQSPEAVMMHQVKAEVERGSSTPQLATAATLSAWAALEGMNRKPSDEEQIAEAAALDQARARAQMERPLLLGRGLGNVSAAKAAVKARFARQEQSLEQAEKHRNALIKDYEKRQEAAKKQKKAYVETQKAHSRAGNKRFKKAIALGTGAVAGALSGLMAGAFQLTQINLMS